MKQHNGFSLAELLIAIAIIGILTTAAIMALKPFDKGIKHIHSNIYYALNRAYYNAMNYWRGEGENRDPFDNNINAGGMSGSARLCNALTEYINTIEGNTKCATALPISKDSAPVFDNEHLMFTAVNGVRYYISEKYDIPAGIENGIPFYLIYADINGTKGPNSLTYKPALVDNRYSGIENSGNKTIQDPDIFVFAALGTSVDNTGSDLEVDAEVIPIGISEFEQRYMTTRIMHPDNSGDYMAYTTESEPYYISKCKAWGYYRKENNVENCGTTKNCLGVEGNQPEYIVHAHNPHTFNDYIRGVIKNTYAASEILHNLNRFEAAKKIETQGAQADKRAEYLKNVNYLFDSCAAEVLEDCQDENVDDSSCQIIVDKFLY